MLSALTLPTSPYHQGAPLTACRDLQPRHGFLASPDPCPVTLALDSPTLWAGQYLRVALRSSRPYRGFILRAEVVGVVGAPVGTWSIPWYSAPDAQYLHCGARAQSAVTHSGPTVQGGLKSDLFLVSLQVISAFF